jgi:hypothetical protein
MDLLTRPYAGDADLPLIAGLIRVSPPASRHHVDFLWRLSSPAIESPDDVRLWAAPDGALHGFAAWQLPWAVLDFYVRPGLLPYWAEARDDDEDRLMLLARHGYTLDDDYAHVIMSRLLDQPLRVLRSPSSSASGHSLVSPRWMSTPPCTGTPSRAHP